MTTNAKPVFKVHMNDSKWVRRQYGDPDSPKLEHYHPALTWCSRNHFKYKVFKRCHEYNTHTVMVTDLVESVWTYQIGFYSLEDAETFKDYWPEVL